MTDTPLVAGQAYGLRTWRVTTGGGEALTGPHQPASWPRAGDWLRASCARPGDHAAPAPRCDCGIHAWHPSLTSARRVLSARWLVPGIVEARGDLEVHHDGFRAEEARPHTLLVARGRNGRQITRLADAYGAEVLEVRGAADVVTYCRERALGFEPAVVAGLLGPVEAEQEVRRRGRKRRTDALRVCAAVIVVGLLCLAGLAATGEQPSGRVLTGRTGEVRTP